MREKRECVRDGECVCMGVSVGVCGMCVCEREVHAS